MVSAVIGQFQLSIIFNKLSKVQKIVITVKKSVIKHAGLNLKTKFTKIPLTK